MRRRKRRRKRTKKGLLLIAFVVFVFCLCAGVRIYSLKAERDALEARQEMLEKQIENEEKRAEELEALEKYMQTRKYMEDVAREKLGLVYPDEILIEPVK